MFSVLIPYSLNNISFISSHFLCVFICRISFYLSSIFIIPNIISPHVIMLFSIPITASFAILLASPAFADREFDPLTKTTLFPGLPVDDGLLANLPPTSSQFTQWGPGWLPQACVDEAGRNKFSPLDIEVYNVSYADCTLPWTFCRHKDSNFG